MSEFLTMYPGDYLPEEKRAIRAYREKLDEVNRRQVNIDDVVSGKVVLQAPGTPSVIQLAEASRKKTAIWVPDDPLYTDPAYAKSSTWGALPAFPTCCMPSGGFFGGLSRDFGDQRTVREHHHYCAFHLPMMADDTIYIVVDNMDFFDITPPRGSIYRTWALRGTGKYYNQNGQLVMTQTCGAKECYKIYEDPSRRGWNSSMEDFDWSNHKFHSYTDSDYEQLRAIWAGEKRRGGDTLYFDMVSVGDTPAPTADGPVTTPEKTNLANGPSFSDLYVKKHFGEAGLIRDEFGIWRSPDEEKRELASRTRPGSPADGGQPPRRPKPDDGKESMDNSPPAIRGRASFENFTGRDAAIRAISNWMGDDGRLSSLSWCIGSEPMMETHSIPPHPNRLSSFTGVPGMESRFTEIHGEAGDAIITRLYVTDKHIDTLGRGIVGLAWWTETIEGQIFTEGTASVALPVR